MTQFRRWVANEETVCGTLGSVQGDPEAKNAVLTSTTVESLTDSQKWDIAGIMSSYDRMQEDQRFTGTPMYIVYAHKANSELCWSSTFMGRALQQLFQSK